jgi:uncharacterized protein YPO0396
MTKEELIKLGVSDETATKIAEKFATSKAEYTTLSSTISERDKQLETLKKSSGDNEKLQKQIEELQTKNKETADNYTAELKSLKVNHSLEKEFTTAKVRNPKTVKPLLEDILEKAELDENGKIKGLTERLKALSDDKETAFLFNVEPPNNSVLPRFNGFKPVDGKGSAPQENIDPMLAGFDSAINNF